MKKSALKARIGELNSTVVRLGEQVRTWKTMFIDTSTELNRLKVEIEAFAKSRLTPDDQLHRIRVLEQDMAELKGEFDPPVSLTAELAKSRQYGRNVLAAVAGQPSVTVTATRAEDVPMAAAATQALKVAEGDMAEKLRELLLGGAEAMGGRQALYLNGLTLGLHPTVAMDRARMGAEAWHAKELAEHAASLKQSGIFKETIVRPPIRFYPDNLEEFRVGVGTANAINKWFKDPPLDQNPPDNILNFLQSIVDKVTWCGKVGKVEGLDGEFRYSEGETAFRISYQRVSLGLYELVDGHWFRATKG